MTLSSGSPLDLAEGVVTSLSHQHHDALIKRPVSNCHLRIEVMPSAPRLAHRCPGSCLAQLIPLSSAAQVMYLQCRSPEQSLTRLVPPAKQSRNPLLNRVRWLLYSPPKVRGHHVYRIEPDRAHTPLHLCSWAYRLLVPQQSSSFCNSAMEFSLDPPGGVNVAAFQ